MKRLIPDITIAIFLLVMTHSAFAMDVISDNELDGVTGQTGIDLILDDLGLDITLNSITWGDTGGIGGTSAAGYVFLENLDSADRINIGVDLSLSIDVATVSTSGFSTAGGATIPIGTSFVKIGLGGANIRLHSLDLGINLSNVSNGLTKTNLGTIHMRDTGNLVEIKSGNVYIFPH